MNLILILVELNKLFRQSNNQHVQKLLLVEFERVKQELLTQCDDEHVTEIKGFRLE